MQAQSNRETQTAQQERPLATVLCVCYGREQCINLKIFTFAACYGALCMTTICLHRAAGTSHGPSYCSRYQLPAYTAQGDRAGFPNGMTLTNFERAFFCLAPYYCKSAF